jgi:endo-1,4-beta-xylanase
MRIPHFSKGKNVLFGLLLLLFFIANSLHAQKICIENNKDQIIGLKDGFRYELWNQYAKGHACMTISEGALFSGEWSGIENYLARRGLAYDKKRKHQEIGDFYATYDCDYNPSEDKKGNSYLSIYGWTVEPLIEYYIIEDWRNWVSYMSPDATFKGSFKTDGSIYDVYTKTRVEKPSIVGITTFQQYFSIRREKRNKGSIHISDHFDQWESLGLTMGKLHEVSFVVEGYKSSGSFEFKELDVFIKMHK